MVLGGPPWEGPYYGRWMEMKTWSTESSNAEKLAPKNQRPTSTNRTTTTTDVSQHSTFSKNLKPNHAHRPKNVPSWFPFQSPSSPGRVRGDSVRTPSSARTVHRSGTRTDQEGLEKKIPSIGSILLCPSNSR